MNFDFTNYTYSGLLSILASLFGVGYPLIVQSIGSIFKQYESPRLSERFSKEPAYIAFRVLLIVNLLVAVSAPFILQAGWFNQVVITIQVVLIVSLIGTSIMLFNLILLYSNADGLLKRVEGKQIDRYNVMDILDIAIYADGQHNMDLYIKSLADVFAYIYQQQGDQPNQGLHKVNPPVVYDNVTAEIISKLREFLRTDDGHHFLYGNNDITPTIYNQISASRLSIQSHILMWRLLEEAVRFNNQLWFNQYWQYADSYAVLKYHYLTYDSPLHKDKQLFVVRHVMIGGMLLHYGRIKWMNDMLFFTHSQPEYYGLIPSSFGEIVTVLEQIDIMCDDFRIFNTQGFNYHDQMDGVNDEKHFFHDAVKYLSLLVIRLWSIDGRILGYGNLFDVPVPPLKLKEDERDAQMMELMKQEVEWWYRNEVFENLPRLMPVEKDKVLALLDDYKTQCENSKKAKEEHPVVSRKKYQSFKESLDAAADSLMKKLPDEDSYSKGLSITTEISDKTILETIHYSDYIDIGVGEIPKMCCANFWNNIAHCYLSCLVKRKKVGNFRVPRKQITNVLCAMGLRDEYAIISTTYIEELPDDAIVLDALRPDKYFFVVRKSEVPGISLMQVDSPELQPLQEGCPICSNIEAFQGCNEPTFVLELTTKFRFSIPNDFSGYVQFMVDEDYSTQDVKITPKQTFDELFV